MTHLEPHVTALLLRARTNVRALAHRASLESGEGVISAAIVVLIMALIGAAMWTLFDQVFTDAGQTIEDRVGSIGD